MSSDLDHIELSAIASAEFAGLRLDQAAAELFPDYSRVRLQKWIRGGELTVDGRVCKPTYRLLGGEHLKLAADVEHHDEVLPESIALDIIHADDDLVVIDKPAGLVVHPAAGNPDGTLQNALLHFDASLATLPRAGIVHRLDKDTSGVMVVARSLRAHTSLVRQLQSRTMSRVYRALVLGDIVAGGTVDAPIGRHPRDRKRMAVVAAGRPAVSHYRVLQRFEALTWLEVSLETGRTHQIRVHMRHLNHPLVGDPVYGRKPRQAGLSVEQYEAVREFPRQALHAAVLKLAHPADGRACRFRAPLPADMRRLLDVMGAAKDVYD